MTALLILILTIGLGSSTENSASSEQNPVKLFSSELPSLLNRYHVEQGSSNSEVKAAVYTRNANGGVGGEHLVDVSLTSTKAGLDLNFYRAKHSVATKSIVGEMNKLEIDFHKAHFEELVRRLVFLAPGETQRQIWFNTVFDLGSTLAKLAKSGGFKLTWFEKNSALNAMILKDNSAVLRMEVAAEQEKSEPAPLGQSFRNWDLKVKLFFSESNEFLKNELTLPVFTDSISSLAKINTELDRILGAKSMINTLPDAKKAFASELKSRFSLGPAPEGSDFKLISEISEALISLEQVETPEGISSFYVVASNGSLTRSVTFYRMKEKDIGKVIDALGLSDFIRTLYDEIIAIFKRVGDEEEKKISTVALTFPEISKSSKKGCNMLRGNDTLMSLAYSEKGDSIKLKITSDKASMAHSHEFARAKFNPGLLEAVFRALIQNSINFARIRL